MASKSAYQQKIDAGIIKGLLAKRHRDDVALSECKTGQTWGSSNLGIFDFWAMKKSYAHPLTVGYEIKVVRSDFLQDNKWPRYLPHCNQFYFVCPTGLIKLNEVPETAGLMYISKTGTRLFTKKKAPYREGTPSSEILTYILFSRAKFGDQAANNETFDNRAFWANWLEQRTLDRDFGWRVGKVLRQTITKRILAAEETAKRQQADIERLERVKVVLEDLGLYPGFADAPQVRARAEMMATTMPPALLRTLADAEKSLVVCQAAIKKHTEGEAKDGP